MSNDKKTLYERLGGYDAIAAVANDLLPRLRADPQLGRFWAHRVEDGVMREKQLLIDFLCASAGGPAAGTWCSSTEACASAIATGTCSSVMPPQPWRSSRCPRPNSATWSRLFRVSRKRSLDNKDAERLCERAAPAPTEVVRGDARVGISRKHESLAIEQQVCLGRCCRKRVCVTGETMIPAD
jgi:Bacterial-like globin